MTTYHNPRTNQTATIVTTDHKLDVVTYSVEGNEVVEPWSEFIKKFNQIVKKELIRHGYKTARG